MTAYATVGIQRIQAHLSRSRHLWGRRGASEQLAWLTALPGAADDTAVGELLQDPDLRGIRINPEGLAVDGVVSLEADTSELAERAALKLVSTMRTTLPGLTATASWTGDTEEAYASLLSPGRESDWSTVTFHPAPAEIPFVHPCDECQTDPASSHLTREDLRDLGLASQFPQGARLCRDCQQRLPSQRRRRTVSGHGPSIAFTAERDLLDRLNSDARPLAVAHDLSELAALGPVVETDRKTRTTTSNHTMLVFADGNGFGDLFDALRRRAHASGSTEELRRVSKAAKAAMRLSLELATRKVLRDDDNCLPVIPHLLGGDDLLASVTAERGWAFLLEFLRSASEEFSRAEELAGVLDELELGVSLSAGVVICDKGYPIGSQVELAESLLRRAKDAVAGSRASIAWLDLTFDNQDEHHAVWTLDDFAARDSALDKMGRQVAGSMTGELRRILAAPLDHARKQLNHQASRMPEVRGLLQALGIDPNTMTAEQVTCILDTFSLGRWWR